VKIFHIITSLEAGGAERTLVNVLSHGLTELGQSVIVCLAGEGKYAHSLRELGLQVFCLEINSPKSVLVGIWRLRKLVIRYNPDLIQGWMYHGNLASLIASWLSNRKNVLIWNIRHSLDAIQDETLSTRLIIWLNKTLSWAPQHIIYNSKTSLYQHKEIGFRSSSELIPNGIDANAIKLDQVRRVRLREQLNIQKEQFVIGHVGRYHPLKDHKTFVKATLELVKTKSDIIVVCIGKGLTWNNVEIQSLIPSEYQHQYYLLGEQDNVLSLMSVFDVFCSTSISEAFPNVILEAMANALPVISTDVGDCRQIVGSDGVVVPARDAKRLTIAIKDIYAKEENERKKIGRSLKKRVSQLYSMEHCISLYTQLYRESVFCHDEN
jgi:glycosyltransferase involved in cell wall biosynthesis